MKFVTVKSKYDGVDAVKLLEEPYQNIIVVYGKVTLSEQTDNADGSATLHINFEYEVADWAGRRVNDLVLFEDTLGAVLSDLIVQGLEANTITYAGGTDGTDGVNDNSEPTQEQGVRS